MKSILFLSVLVVISLAAFGEGKVKGYILKTHEGEDVGVGIIKISPKTGSSTLERFKLVGNSCEDLG